MPGTDGTRARLRRLLSATLSLAVLGGCTVGPNYHHTVQPAPAQWHESLPAADSHVTTQPITARWWELYGDPELTSLEEQVVAGNLDLRIASSRLDQSLAERNIARAARLPHVDGAASYARERASPNGVMSLLGTGVNQSTGTIASGQQGFGPAAASGSSGSSDFDLPQYGVSASWEVDLWGHVRRQIEVANATLQAAQDQRRDILVSLMAETASDYIALRSVQAQIALTGQNLDTAKRLVDLTRLREREGASARFETAAANGQMHDFEARLPALRSQEAHLLNALSFLVGREPGALTAELGKVKAVPPVPKDLPVGLPSQLAERRPDVRMAEEKLHAATASIGVAISEFFPRLTLSGSLDIQALQFGNLGTWASRQYGFGPTMTLPLFEGGKLKGQVRLRRAEQREAAIALQRTMLKAWQEIDDAMADLSAAQTRRGRLADEVEANRVALDMAQRQYEAGSGDFLRVLTMQATLQTNEITLTEAGADIASASTRLYRALGGGWDTVYPDCTGKPCRVQGG